jgi:membrane protein implicated in regulation of membrane protease activity
MPAATILVSAVLGLITGIYLPVLWLLALSPVSFISVLATALRKGYRPWLAVSMAIAGIVALQASYLAGGFLRRYVRERHTRDERNPSADCLNDSPSERSSVVHFSHADGAGEPTAAELPCENGP